MNKKIYAILGGLFMATQVSAQYSYTKLGAGFHIPAMRQEMSFNNLNPKEGSFGYEESIARYSMHRGIAPLVSFGHMFNKNVGFEIGVSYLIASQNKALQTALIGGNAVYNELTSKADNINFYPALRLAAPLGKYISVYTRAGLVVPVLSVIKEKFSSKGFDTMGNPQRIKIDSEVKNRFTMGFAGAVGFDCSLSPKTIFFIEVNAQLLNTWSKSGKVTLYEVNGKDQLSSMQTYQKETRYKKVMAAGYNSPGSPGRPSEVLTYQSPFHSLGISAGLSFRL